MLAASPPRTSSVARIALSSGARTQIGLFLLAYLVYSAARWLMVGDLASAQDHAAWIVDLEQNVGVASEASVQRALTGTWILWLLNHAYVAAQLVVVPGALIFLYRRSRPIYDRLRNTILATWLISVPVYAAFPVAPPRLADIGLVDTISQQTGFAMDSNLTRGERARLRRRHGRGAGYHAPPQQRRDERPGAAALLRRGLRAQTDRKRQRGADDRQHRARADEERGQPLR
jgi:hypothetical protein